MNEKNWRKVRWYLIGFQRYCRKDWTQLGSWAFEATLVAFKPFIIIIFFEIYFNIVKAVDLINYRVSYSSNTW